MYEKKARRHSTLTIHPNPLIRHPLYVPPAYNIDASKENATQTPLLKTDNTRETETGHPPPTQATHDFLRFFTVRNYNVLFYYNKVIFLAKKIYI